MMTTLVVANSSRSIEYRLASLRRRLTCRILQQGHDQPWLTVSHDGLAVAISADPTGLALGQHFANVAITSSAAGVAAGDTVRVGLYVFDTPASSEVIADGSGFFCGATEVDPVRPLLYGIHHNLVRAYHVYDNKIAFDIDLGIQQGTLSGLAASLDGRHLYAAATDYVYDIDLDSRTVQRRLSYAASGAQCPPGLLYMRIRGRELLVDRCLNGWVDLAAEGTRPASLFGSAHTMVLGYNSAEVIVRDSDCAAVAYEIDVGDRAMSLLNDVSRMVLEDCAIGGPVMRILRSSRDGTVVVAQGAGRSTTWKYRRDGTYAPVAGTVSDGARDLVPLDDGRAYAATSNSVSLVSAAGEIVGTIPLGASVFPDSILLSFDGERLFAHAFNADQQRGECHVVDAIH
jgi:hypothetical protein